VTPFEWIQLMTGGGIIAMLWRIQRELGCIKTAMSHLDKGQDDHEQRIRKLEANR
jgi:hypothetical protein